MSAFTSSIRPMLRATSAAGLSARTFSSSSPCSIARMFLTGRLSAAPELQATSTGQELIKYSVATSYGSKDNKQTSFFKVTSFQGEGAQRDYLLGLQKGTLVCLEGDCSIRQWEDSEGKKQNTLSIVQKSIEVLKRPYIPENSENSEN